MHKLTILNVLDTLAKPFPTPQISPEVTQQRDKIGFIPKNPRRFGRYTFGDEHAVASAIPLEQQHPLADLSTDPSAHVVSDGVTQSPAGVAASGPRGRFLHITDFHPDQYYKAGTLLDEKGGTCHRGKGPAGYFGAEGSDCDSPLSLVNETFRWIEENLKDEIDFVIWTGDSVRHDNDEKHPRTADEIVELNQFMAQKWVDLFGVSDQAKSPATIPRLSVPVIPTFGNNDILPHNIFREGPNTWTKKFAEIWRHFIPEDQRHTFVEGGWFTTEVIPGKLAVISLNTMYFFESNSAVDGCNAKSEPGYEHMEWLRVQLQLLRSRGMKAILMGHVAPARSNEKKNWDESCWQMYTLWMDRYRDVVVTGLYGHMNIDHFILQDSHKVDIDAVLEKSTSDTITTLSKEDYLVSLRKQWSSLPSPPSGLFEKLRSSSDSSEFDSTKKKSKKEKKKEKKEKKKYLKKIGGPFAERYSLSLVSPSLVPNYFPTLRVVEYNITGLEADSNYSNDRDSSDLSTVGSTVHETQTSEIDIEKKKKKKKDKDNKPPSFKIPDAPSSTAPPGPAYSNQPFTLLSYTQYFANLTRINEEAASQGNKAPKIDFEVEYSTNDNGACQMTDLTVRSFLELAIRIGEDGAAATDITISPDPLVTKKKKVNEAWHTFLSRAFTGFVDVDDMTLSAYSL
ncbi:Endopolyphosphatase [Penicillium cataractarum]|uniref:Endopolyphosphatase n=1 Tax=Penicillium cataractarum TaxID=2100454 RepID=A0A9W9RZL9_9EURO|nr:Endopolyphosphatase [Penicillium cataractarum]KAJ5369301.1 Endopolyphosphatase [Penicillium cataractarum]